MNNKPFSRSERVSQQVLKTINDILTREMDLRKYGFITFSSVKMTADLKHATLYYSVLNPTKEIKIINKELPVDDPKQRCPNIEIANKELGWQPSFDREVGLKKTIEYFDELLNKEKLK